MSSTLLIGSANPFQAGKVGPCARSWRACSPPGRARGASQAAWPTKPFALGSLRPQDDLGETPPDRRLTLPSSAAMAGPGPRPIAAVPGSASNNPENTAQRIACWRGSLSRTPGDVSPSWQQQLQAYPADGKSTCLEAAGSLSGKAAFTGFSLSQLAPSLKPPVCWPSWADSRSVGPLLQARSQLLVSGWPGSLLNGGQP